MSRRQQWTPSAPEFIRLRKVAPGTWDYYFPGYRSNVPRMLWTVQRKGPQYLVTATAMPAPRAFSQLNMVREFIASHYEYLPKNPK